MKIKRVLFVNFLILLITICCSSCKKSTDAITFSVPFGNDIYLKSAEPDMESMKNIVEIDYPYNNINCYVYEIEGKLYITDGRGKRNNEMVCLVDNGYFYASAIHMDYGVLYYPYYYVQGGADESPVQVTNEFPVGFLKVNNRHGLLFTENPYNDSGSLYELKYSYSEEKWVWKTVFEFSGMPEVFTFGDEGKDNIYVATSQGLYYIVLEQTEDLFSTVRAESLPTPEYWNHYLAINSVVKQESKLYFGAAQGVVVYDLETHTDKWYPVDYSKYF